MKVEDFWTQLAEDIDFDALKGWCEIFGITYEPPLDDDMPDWESDLRGKLAEKFMKMGG